MSINVTVSLPRDLGGVVLLKETKEVEGKSQEPDLVYFKKPFYFTQSPYVLGECTLEHYSSDPQSKI